MRTTGPDGTSRATDQQELRNTGTLEPSSLLGATSVLAAAPTTDLYDSNRGRP